MIMQSLKAFLKHLSANVSKSRFILQWKKHNLTYFTTSKCFIIQPEGIAILVIFRPMNLKKDIMRN